MIKKKINSGYETETIDIEKRMLKYFPKDYNYFFKEPLCGTNNFSDKNTYIPNKSVEQQLNTFFSSDKNMLSVLIGYSGMGKSTILKNYLQIQSSDRLFLDEDKIVFSKFAWNYNHLKANAYSLSNIIHNINSKICALYHIVSADINESFFDFIVKRESDLISVDCSIQQSLDELKKKNNEIFEIRRFQFLLHKLKVRSFTFVIDNIENLKSSRRYIFLSKLMECFRLLTECVSEKPIIKLLFSFQPSTLYEAEQYGCFDEKEILLYIKQLDTINLEKFFSLKLKHYNKNSGYFEVWNRCLPLFIKVSQKYNRKYDYIIKKLCNYSVPASMKIYSNILSNARWIHNTTSDYHENDFDFFNIDSLVINNITVIRAIACLEDEMFVPKVPINNYNLKNFFCDYKNQKYATPICNLLYSTQTDDYSILILYIIKFFYKYCKKNNLYGTIYIKHWDIVRVFSEIFFGIDEIENKISICILYLFNMQIIDKSIKTKQGEKSGLTTDSRLYLTPKGEIMWEMLEWDSVLLEIFREDHYRDYSPNSANNPYCSYVLMQTGQQHEIFSDLIRLIFELLKEEKIYRTQAERNDTTTSLKHNFGDKCICAQLFEGLKQSMSYSGLIKNDKISETFYQLQEAIEATNL